MKKNDNDLAEEAAHQEGRFSFYGESLALDLVNTEVVVRGKSGDLLQTGEDVKAWWDEVRSHYPEIEDVQGEDEVVYDAALLEAIKALRDALRHIFGALVEDAAPMDADLHVLNEVLQTGYRVLERREDEEGSDLFAVYHTHDKTRGKILLPIALSALHLIQDSERKRLHKCANERCILYFYDTTRSATRRWCSQGCMDRARSAQHYKQLKETKTSKVPAK